MSDSKNKPKQSTSESNALQTHRHLLMLMELPKGRWVGTREIHRVLEQAGYEVTLRTVQRDLVQLSETFLIEHDGSNPRGWRWRTEATPFNLPQMTLSQAMVFALAEQNLHQLLPQSLLDQIQPWFELARTQLAAGSDNWLSRIRFVPDTQRLIGPEVKNSVQEAVYKALQLSHKLEITYQKPAKSGAEQPAQNYTLEPLGLVQRGVKLYLLAKDAKAPHITKQFVLHRILEAVNLAESADTSGFDLQEYLSGGHMDFIHPELGAKPMKVTLELESAKAKSFSESKLSEDQSVHELQNGLVRIKATLVPTFELIWWLRRFGKGLISVKPAKLSKLVFEEADL